ncbi:hypothetical protein JD844_017246 [Phrynosoma platyrhinos]|uniref:Uncharacterized protein n=1 Tax=Phrynosoma platyrhinos TaxID=52577 RepID=A0ABQ7SLN7_PHRPL|nr:hypothetical protein JD844_017246 [Phrynosoma platyrhinos]
MILQCPSHILLLGTVFLLQDPLAFCERPSWANVAWDTTTQDLEQLLTKEQPKHLRNSVCQICHSIISMGLSKGCLEMLYTSCKVALFIVVGLSVHYILLKLINNVKPSQAMIPTSTVSITAEAKKECTQDMDKMLYKLVSNTSKMMKYMKHVAHHQKKEAKYYKISKKRKGSESDNELFVVCPNNHSSCCETSMYES